MADRAERRSAPARTQRLASRVLAAREPKLLRAATRLAAARTRMSWAAASWAVTRNYSELPPEGQTTGPARPAPAMQRAVAPRVASGALRAPASSALQGAPAPATRRVVARAPAPPHDAAGTAGTAGRSATPATVPALTPESLGLGPASFEWLFGDPETALSHPDVTSGPLVSPPPMSSEQRTARRVARLTARGGSQYGRGAEIREGAAKPPDPPAPVEAAGKPPAGGPPPATASQLTTTPPPLATPPSPAAPPSPEPAPSPAAPASPEPAPTVEAVQRQLQRMRRDPAPASPPAAPRRPERQRLVPGRRPAAIARREVARAVADPVPATAPDPMPATPSEPATAAAPPAERAGRNVHHADVSSQAPPATAPGVPTPPSARPATLRAAPVRPELAHRSLPARTRPALQRAPRRAIEPIPSPAPPRADVTAPPAPRKPSLLRRALAALTPPAPPATVAPPRSEPAAQADFGVPANTYVAAAPKSGVAVPRPTLNARPPATPQPLSRAPITAPATAAAPQTPVFTPPPPPLWAPAEHSSTKPLARAPADPPAYAHPATPHPATPHPATPHPATPGQDPSPTHNPAAAQPAQTTPPADADAAYRDVLLRAREEREQLGRLISHPF